MGRTFTIIVNSAVALVLLTAPVARVSGATFVVTSRDHRGLGTLRQALHDAANGDTITFDPSVFPRRSTFPSANTISLTTELPELVQGNLVIDASDARVVVDGSGITNTDAYGLHVKSNDNIIRGLQFVHFSQAGIGLSGGVQHNTIGGDRQLGTGPTGQGNWVTGNGTFGIGLWSPGTSSNTIQGNVIGTDPDGITRQGNFSGGIFSDGASGNTIVDNLIGGYVDNGVNLGGVIDGHNTVRGNYIGTDPTGVADLASNSSNGIAIDNSSYNTVGPDNVIANNGGAGILVSGVSAVGNNITRNSIYNNGSSGIDLSAGGNKELAAPLLVDVDLQAGRLTGWACPNCIVEIFSDDSDQGALYEGRVVADNSSAFAFSKGAALTGPHLTATATDPAENTSEFSSPSTRSRQNFNLQAGNPLPMFALQSRTSSQLVADIRLGLGMGFSLGEAQNWRSLAQQVFDIGAKRVDTFYGEIEAPIDWNVPEDIPSEYGQFIAAMNANGVAVNYAIHWFNKVSGPPLPIPRFKNQAEIDRFLDYVSDIVNLFGDRVQYYTLWTEPDACGGAPENDVKCIEPLDYINLAAQTVPVILAEASHAKIVTGPVVLFFGRDHLFRLVESNTVALFDVINTHPMFDAAPDQTTFFRLAEDGTELDNMAEYYYQYPALVDSILYRASVHGFQGQYWGTDLSWFVTERGDSPYDDQWAAHTEIQATKYQVRGVVMHLGRDAGVNPVVLQGTPEYAAVAKLYTILVGTKPADLGVGINSGPTGSVSYRLTHPTSVSYGFAHPNGDKSFTLWLNDAAVDDDPGEKTTLTFPGMSASRVTGLDVLGGFAQELVTETVSGDLVIRSVLVKDYPIILRISDPTPTAILTEGLDLPATYELGDSYPNPFNPTTSISFQVPARSRVSIKIYNLIGQEIRDLVEKDFEPGFHKIEWNGLDNMGRTAATGVYLIQMKSDHYVTAKKCLLLR